MSNPASVSVTTGISGALLTGLHRATSATVSADTSVQLLRSVGVESARAVLDGFADWTAEARMDRTSVENLAEGEFWSLLSEFFGTQGWGSLEHEHLHPGVIAVSSPDWAEVEAAAGAATCHFTTGLLAELLRLVADDEVAVLEVECRSTGARSCRFLVGSPETLETLYASVRSGSAVRHAIGSLG
jgi:predicted hydrocarbon binding protein